MDADIATLNQEHTSMLARIKRLESEKAALCNAVQAMNDAATTADFVSAFVLAKRLAKEGLQ